MSSVLACTSKCRRHLQQCNSSSMSSSTIAAQHAERLQVKTCYIAHTPYRAASLPCCNTIVAALKVWLLSHEAVYLKTRPAVYGTHLSVLVSSSRAANGACCTLLTPARACDRQSDVTQALIGLLHYAAYMPLHMHSAAATAMPAGKPADGNIMCGFQRGLSVVLT